MDVKAPLSPPRSPPEHGPRKGRRPLDKYGQPIGRRSGIVHQDSSNEATNALGFVWFMRFMAGDTITTIARSTGRERHSVARHIKKAAALLADAAQEKVMQELFPLALDLYKVYMEQQLEAAKKGQPVNLEAAERVLKGMFVFDAPQLKEQMAQLPEGEPQETLAAFFATRRLPPIDAPQVIEGKKVEDQIDVET